MADYRLNQDRIKVIAMIENTLTEEKTLTIAGIQYKAMRNFGLGETTVKKILELGVKSGRWETDKENIYARGTR